MKTLSLSLLALLLLTPALTAAAPVDTATADGQALRECGNQYLAAYNQGNAVALAALWAPEGQYANLSTGLELKGRAEIEKHMATLFAAKQQGKLTATTDHVRIVSPTTAIIRGVSEITRDNLPPQSTTYTVVYVKQDGQWLIGRMTDDLSEAAAAGAAELKQLEWMVGSWTYEGENEVRVETTVEWTDQQHFLQRTFRVFQGQVEGPTSTELITFDPLTNELISYVTNSDGSYGQATWEHDGNRWVVRQVGTLAGGESFSATEIFRFVNDNAFVWQSTDRLVDGQREPDTREVLVARTGSIDTTSDAN